MLWLLRCDLRGRGDKSLDLGRCSGEFCAVSCVQSEGVFE
jgi:hypothetical protein